MDGNGNVITREQRELLNSIFKSLAQESEDWAKYGATQRSTLIEGIVYHFLWCDYEGKEDGDNIEFTLSLMVPGTRKQLNLKKTLSLEVWNSKL